MFDFTGVTDYDESECNYYYWLIDKAFALLKTGEYLEFYTKTKSIWKHDGEEEIVFHDYLIGRLSSFDLFFFAFDKLMIIKDYDVFDCDISDNMNKPHANTWVALDKIDYIKFPKRVYE